MDYKKERELNGELSKELINSSPEIMKAFGDFMQFTQKKAQQHLSKKKWLP